MQKKQYNTTRHKQQYKKLTLKANPLRVIQKKFTINVLLTKELLAIKYADPQNIYLKHFPRMTHISYISLQKLVAIWKNPTNWPHQI